MIRLGTTEALQLQAGKQQFLVLRKVVGTSWQHPMEAWRILGAEEKAQHKQLDRNQP